MSPILNLLSIKDTDVQSGSVQLEMNLNYSENDNLPQEIFNSLEEFIQKMTKNLKAHFQMIQLLNLVFSKFNDLESPKNCLNLIGDFFSQIITDIEKFGDRLKSDNSLASNYSIPLFFNVNNLLII